MQRVRQLCYALTLTCLLAPAVWADDGVMHPELTPPPPPPSAPPTQSDITNPEAPGAEDAALINTMIQLTLDLVNMLGQL